MGFTVSPDALDATQEVSEAAEDRLMRLPYLHVILSPTPPDQAAERLNSTEFDNRVSDLQRKMG